MLKGEMLGQVFAQRLNPVALRCMVACGVEMDAAFTGNMEGLLGHLTGDEGIQPQRHGLFDITLRATGAPGKTLYRPVMAGNEHRLAPEAGLQLPGQRSEEHTSELQSRENLVCRLLLEKKNS